MTTPPGRNRRILALAIPAIGALVADPLLGLVDTAVVGRLGAVPLAALGLSVAVLATVSWVFNFLVYGTTAAVARAMGAGDRAAAGRRVAHAAWVAVAAGLVVTALVWVSARPVMVALGAVPEVVGPATEYLRIRAFGVVALLLTFVGHGAFRGVSDTRTPLVLAVAANLLNAALDVVLVLQLGWGLAGAAWATVAAEVAAAAAFGILIRRAGLPLAGHGRPRGAELRVFAAVSRDLVLRTAGLLLGLLAVTSVAARMGAVPAAAHQIIWQVWVTVSLVLDGFAVAGQALVGTALGAGDVRAARGYARALVGWGVGGGFAIAATLIGLSEALPRALTDDPVVLAAVATAWWFAAAGHAMNGTVFVLDGVLMGAGDFAYLRNWTVTAALAVAAPFAYLAWVAGWGLLGLWVAVQAMMVVRLASLVLRLRGERWARPGGEPPRPRPTPRTRSG